MQDLPNELLVEIFSHFDLKTLTRCMRVNKSFEAITKHSAFDKVFFRTRAIKLGESINLDQLHVNPVFRKINYSCRSEDVHFLFCDEKPGSRIGFRRLALIDSSAGHQNATEPAVTCLYLDVYGSGAEMLVEPKRGVTVQTVMQALCDCRPGCNYRSHHFSFKGFYKSAKSKDGLILEAQWGSQTGGGSFKARS
jgi:hypothetical protein